MNVFVGLFCSLHLITGLPNELPIRGESHIEKKAYDNIENYESSKVAREEITFRLWTRDQTNSYVPLYYGELGNAESIRPMNPFKFFIHGYLSSADSVLHPTFRAEYLKMGDYNLIEVDWKEPAYGFYPFVVGLTRKVGSYIGELVVDLNSTLGVPFENIHLIGHSLGSHVSAFAGNYVEDNTGRRVGRITGLDPAGPLFTLAPARNRLSPGDADFVDVIHTDDGKLGLYGKIGDVDIYPNGGAAPQPGCMFRSVLGFATCSHIRVFEFFTESINSLEFIAKECSSFRNYKDRNCNDAKEAIMGEHISTSTRGTFYLTTNKASPYARNGVI